MSWFIVLAIVRLKMNNIICLILKRWSVLMSLFKEVFGSRSHLVSLFPPSSFFPCYLPPGDSHRLLIPLILTTPPHVAPSFNCLQFKPIGRWHMFPFEILTETHLSLSLILFSFCYILMFRFFFMSIVASCLKYREKLTV